jgi:hypothetical protein
VSDAVCACKARVVSCLQKPGPNGLCATCDCPGYPHHDDHLKRDAANGGRAEAMSCPAWEDGVHQFRPGFIVKRKTLGQEFAERACGGVTPEKDLVVTFTPLDSDDHRTDAKQCACGLVVKAKKKR